MKIGICGTHGTGKSMFALRLATQFKAEYPGKQVGLLSEVVRSCPFPVNQQTSVLAQAWIFHSQMIKEIEMESRNDILICDRTILDSVAYSERAGFMDQMLLHLTVALSWITTYGEIYFLRPHDNPAADGFRDTDVDFQKEVDQILAGYIKTYGISVFEERHGNAVDCMA